MLVNYFAHEYHAERTPVNTVAVVQTTLGAEPSRRRPSARGRRPCRSPCSSFGPNARRRSAGTVLRQLNAMVCLLNG